MKTSPFFLLVILLAFLSATVAQAQSSDDPPSKVEVGIQFSSISYPQPTVLPLGSAISPGLPRSEAGFGGRFTFNLNRHVALEAEGNFFPHENFADFSTGGRLLQGQFGVKAGKRFGKFGLFAKARPGFASFSKVFVPVGTTTIDINGQPVPFPVFGDRRRTKFSMDLGGVLEFYPSRKILTRIDVGDTLIHHAREDLPAGLGTFQNARTTHNLQVSAGIGFRFGSLQPETATPQTVNDELAHFEVGAQFSSLSVHQIEHSIFVFITPSPFPDFHDTINQAGFGGRFTFNLNRNFALEAQGDFYPRENVIFNNGRAGGRILQGQAGVKAGQRYEKFGLFAKARPGVVSFGRAITVDGFDPTFGFPIFRFDRKTYFSMDLGGVLEFYPTRRIVTRFDGGDTMIFYRGIDLPVQFFPAQQFFHVPAETTHNFQFSAGVGFRF
jgi:hypothetical protein